MDRETAKEVRDCLLAMRGILRLWEGPGDEDTELVVEWLLGLWGRLREMYPLEGPLSPEITALERLIADIGDPATSAQERERLWRWVSALAVDVERDGVADALRRRH